MKVIPFEFSAGLVQTYYNRTGRIQERYEWLKQGPTEQAGQVNEFGVTVRNSPRGILTEEKAVRYQKIWQTTAGESTAVKSAGGEIDNALLEKLDSNFMKPPFAAPSLNTTLAVISFLPIAFDAIRDDKDSRYLQQVYELEDMYGAYHLQKVSTDHVLWETNAHFFLVYDSGSFKGKRIEVSEGAFDLELGKAQKKWGYEDWKGDFVPGTDRKSLPTYDENGNQIYFKGQRGHVIPS